MCIHLTASRRCAVAARWHGERSDVTRRTEPPPAAPPSGAAAGAFEGEFAIGLLGGYTMDTDVRTAASRNPNCASGTRLGGVAVKVVRVRPVRSILAGRAFRVVCRAVALPARCAVRLEESVISSAANHKGHRALLSWLPVGHKPLSNRHLRLPCLGKPTMRKQRARGRASTAI